MKRSDRLVAITHFLLENRKKRFSLPYFVEQFGAAKSSISEDFDIIDRMFQQLGIGKIESIAGASGGIQYLPDFTYENSTVFIDQLIEQLEDPNRILPGGFVYMSDILGDINNINSIGKIFGSVFKDLDVDYVITIATKGIPLAYGVAQILNVPVIIIRRDPIVTEGSTVSINYVSGSSKKIQTMVLAKRSIEPGSNVIIIDDFMKAGGTIRGIKSLMKEFDATVQGIGVLAEAEDYEEDRKINDYVSLLKIEEVNEQSSKIRVNRGNFFK